MTLRGKNNQLELFEKDYSEFAKPILKWAGGKNQLIEDIDKVLPEKFRVGGYFTYIEPFVGSGALTFHLLKNYYSKIDKIVINDSEISRRHASSCDLMRRLARSTTDAKVRLDRDLTRRSVDTRRDVFDRYSTGVRTSCYLGLHHDLARCTRRIRSRTALDMH